MATRHVGPGQQYTTLVAANNAAQAGDVMIVHGGTYPKQFTPKSGTTWQAFSLNDKPIIDGGWNRGSVHPSESANDAGMGIGNANVTVKGFEIRNINGRGITFGAGASNVVIEDLHIHHTLLGGVVGNPTGNPIVGITLRRLLCEYISLSGIWYETPVNGCFLFKSCYDVLVEDCIVRYGHGEGMAAGSRSKRLTFRRNTIHDTAHLGMYVSNRATEVLVEDCIIYQRGLDDYRQGDGDVGAGFVLGDEDSGSKDNTWQHAENVTLRRCVSVNTGGAFGLRNNWKINPKTGETDGYDTKIKNLVVENCTFVGGPDAKRGVAIDKNPPEFGGDKMGGFFQNCLFVLNVMHPQNNTNSDRYRNEEPGIVFRNNAWTTPIPAGLGSSNIQVPLNALVNPNANLAGGFDIDNYRPVVGGALDGKNYGALDAINVGPSVTASFTANPSATTLTQGTNVAFTNTSYAKGGATLILNNWEIKRGTTVVKTAQTSNLTYNFPDVGTYTVKLTMTASVSGGSNITDSTTKTYTIEEPTATIVITASFNNTPTGTTHLQGTALTFNSTTTVQNGSLGSLLWQVMTQPGGTVVASGSGQSFSHVFGTVGTWRVKLTATAATGESDVETRDFTITEVSVPTVTAAFTSSEADYSVAEGGSITFTSTSTASVPITSYNWRVEKVGGTGAITYATANITHAFTEAGVYNVTLTVGTAEGVSDSETKAVSVTRVVTEGSDFLVAPQSFVVNTTTGVQTVVSPALGTQVPRGVHVRLVGATALDTPAGGALWSEGAASATAQWVHCRFSADAAATTQAKRRYSTSSIMMTIDATGAKTGEAKFVRFVPGGVELDITDTFPAEYRAEAIFYAGNDCRFYAGSQPLVALGQVATVETGISPDIVFMASCSAATEDTADANADLSLGWALRDGPQFHYKNRDKDASPDSFLLTRMASRIGSSADGGTGTSYSAFEAQNFTPTSFDLEVFGSDMPRTVSVYAVSIGDSAATLVAAQVTATPLSIPLDFEAQTVLGLTTTFVGTAPAAQQSGTSAETVGWFTASTHGLYSTSGNISAVNSAAISATRSYRASGIKAVGHSGVTLWEGQATISETSFGITWSTAPAGDYWFVVLAIQKGTEVVGGGDAPIADFVMVSSFDEETGVLTVVFDSSPSNGNGAEMTYLWDFGDGSTADVPSPIHTFTGEGVVTVTLTVTTEHGSSSKSAGILVPAQPVWEDELIGPIDPETSGGHTDNFIDRDRGTHTHAIKFDSVIHLKPGTPEQELEWRAEPPDPEYILIAAFEGRDYLSVKFPDGRIRYLYTETISGPQPPLEP